ncbi:hypothetical protein D1007_17898 [Hordeum vulgare]|nr:hypothetical protein D1007_17898 [Hordeum vulgare]
MSFPEVRACEKAHACASTAANHREGSDYSVPIEIALNGRFDGDMDVVLKTLSVNSPRGGGPVPAWAPMRHAEKPTQHVGGPRAGGGAGRAIRQPR